MDDKKIRDLPLNGRDFVQLALLQPGVVHGLVQSKDVNRGFGTKMSVGGSRYSQNLFLMDGVDLADVQGNTPGSLAGGLLGVETLREFTTITNAYSAEYGKVSGGIVNAVSKSGTNELHGTGFYFHRNDNLDARNFFDRGKPEFKKNQFGGVVSGPIRKDSTFFMGGYEGVRQGLGTTRIANVPNALARQGILPVAGGGTQTIQINQFTKPYLDLFPLPNGRDFGDGRGEYLTSSTDPTVEDYFSVRADQKLSENDLFFVRYSFDNATTNSPNTVGTVHNDIATRNQSATLEETRIFSSTLLNTFRFGFARSKLSQIDMPLHPLLTDPAVMYVPGKPLSGLSITGLAGATVGADQIWIQNNFQWSDVVTYQKGRHGVKFGANITRFQSNILAATRTSGWGQLRFTSLRNMLLGVAGDFNGPIGEQPPETFEVRQSLLGFFVQDDLRLNPNFTLNLGLRYEFITVPGGRPGKSTLVDLWRDTVNTEGAVWRRNPSLKNVAPRLGLAWNPRGNQKTTIRAGVGIFYDQLLGRMLKSSPQPPFWLSGQIRNPTLPVSSTQLQPGTTPLILNTMFYDFEQPTRLRYSFTLHRELPGQTVVSAGYTGAHGWHQIRLLDEWNSRVPQILPDGRKFFAPNVPRKNPAIGNIRIRFPDNNNFYNSMLLSLNKRFSGGLQFQASYTFSKNISEDDLEVSGGTESENAAIGQDPDDHLESRALSNLDIRHNLVFNYTYDLPLGRGNRLGGWQIGGIASFSTGNPFSAGLGFDNARQIVRSAGGGQRPDLLPGASNNPILGGPDKYFDPLVFTLPEAGFLGNLGRNTLTGPGVANFDFSLTKMTRIGESSNLQFRAEFFNLTNHANFTIPASTIFTSAGPLGSAGRITSTRTTARRIQFGLKLLF